MAEIKQIKVGSTTYDVADQRVDTMIPSTSTIGSATRAIYLNNGALTACSADFATATALNNKMDKANPTGTGVLSMNGNFSVAADGKVTAAKYNGYGVNEILVTSDTETGDAIVKIHDDNDNCQIELYGTPGEMQIKATAIALLPGYVFTLGYPNDNRPNSLMMYSNDTLALYATDQTSSTGQGSDAVIAMGDGSITLTPTTGNLVNVNGKFQATNLTDGTTTKTMTEVLAGGGSPMDTYLQATSASGTVTLSNKSGTGNLQIQPIGAGNNLYLKSGSRGTTTIFGGHGVEIDGGDDSINIHNTGGPMLLNTDYSIVLTGGGDELGCILLQDQDEYTKISLNNEDPATYNRDITFRSDFGTITLGEIINHIHTCYRGDTTYISMADGTQKLISEVRDGDEVLGIDVRTNEVVTTKVIKVFKTQSVNYYDLYITEDGKTLDINGVEKLITCSADDNVDHLIETSELQKCIDKDERRRLHHRLITIDENKNIDYTRASAYFKKIMLENFTDAYVIYTVNGTYFVNGICGCHVPKGLYENMHKRHIAIPEAAEKVLQTLISNSSKYDTNLPTAVIGDEAVRDLYINYAAANRTIASKKQYLSSTDYKKTKYDEGVLAEDEWLTVKAARQAARDAINEAEVQRDQYKAELLKINHPISLESGVNRRRYWNEDMAYLMSEPAQAALNAWADENKAKYEEKLAKKAAAAARKALKN